MGAHVIKVLVAALSLFAAEAAACSYPDEGNMPLHRAVTRAQLLPETEAWARAVRKDGVVVHYAVLLEETLHSGGRCYWTIEARAEGKVWRRFFVSPDGKNILVEKP